MKPGLRFGGYLPLGADRHGRFSRHLAEGPAELAFVPHGLLG